VDIAREAEKRRIFGMAEASTTRQKSATNSSLGIDAMPTHAQIWNALDRLAARGIGQGHDLSDAQDGSGSVQGTAYDGCVLDGLRWNQKRQKAHEGGSRKREELLPLLTANQEMNGRNIVLIDEIVTTGGNLLACEDRLIAGGAKVVGAVTCGRSVYDLNDPPYGARTFDLTEQLQDYH
jgi:hypothetical protein